MASRNMHFAATTTSSTFAARARDFAGAQMGRAHALPPASPPLWPVPALACPSPSLSPLQGP